MFNLVLALLAGVVTIAAPCTLPMLPILLGASVGQTGKARPALIALGFVISFSAAALLLSAITRIFDFDPNVLRTGAAILMLAIAYGGQAVTTRVRSIARISPRLQQGFGVVVIAFAVASYFQYDTLIVAWLTGFYPNGQIGL